MGCCTKGMFACSVAQMVRSCVHECLQVRVPLAAANVSPAGSIKVRQSHTREQNNEQPVEVDLELTLVSAERMVMRRP